MKWSPLHIDNVTSSRVVYFNQFKNDVCEKISKAISIDCFPDSANSSYWLFENNQWTNKHIKYEFDVIDAFHQQVIGLFETTDSNIIFRVKNNLIDGVIHFTDYENTSVYSNIYRNLNVFETQLKEYLSNKGLTDSDFLDYLKFKKQKAYKKGKKSIEYYDKEINRFSDNMNVDSRPFSNLYLIDLLKFSVSSFTNKHQLGLDFLKEKTIVNNKIIHDEINELRNIVMHHRDISGQTLFKPHEFEYFKHFFHLNSVFKNSFNSLSLLVNEMERERRTLVNSHRLEMISKFSDAEVVRFFYSLS